MKKPSQVIVKFDYSALVTLARVDRNPLLLTLAELSRLSKTEPMILDNEVFRACGFSRHDKRRNLRLLEQRGMIKVESRGKKPPLIWAIY